MNRTVITVIMLIAVGLAGAMAVWAFSSNNSQEAEHEGEEMEQESPAEEEEEEAEETSVSSSLEELVSCLEENGVVIYGSVTCPFCYQLAQSFGGYEVVDSIYVECSRDRERCDSEMQTRGVPEIQINGVLYQGSRDPGAIGRAAGCEFEG